MPVVPEDALVAGLRAIRENGLATADIPDTSPLLQLRVVIRSAPTGAAPSELRRSFRDVFPVVVATDLDGLIRDVAVPLFGLGIWEGRSYGDRIDEIERLTGSDWNTSYRKLPQDKLLRAIANALAESSVTLIPATAEPKLSPGYVVSRLAFSQRFQMEPEPVRQTLEHRLIRALTDDVDGMSIQTRTRRIDRYGKMLSDIQMYGADEIVLTDETEFRDGIYWDSRRTYRVNFGRHLEVGEEVQFWIIRVDDTTLRTPDDEHDRGWLSALITASPGEFEAQVTFPKGYLPKDSYWFAQLPLAGEPVRDPNRRLPLRGRTLSYRFPNVQMSHSYGVVWNY
jgi:hypothetical protein